MLGVEGSFADGWTYNIYLQRSTGHIDFDEVNDLGNAQMAAALNVLPGPTGPVCGAQSGMTFISNSKCVPWNIWIPGGVMPASLGFMSVPAFTTGHVTEQIASGSMTADLGQYGIELPVTDEALQVNL